MKVLIVDDDPNTVQMIEDSIPWEEYGISEIFAAYHGQMAMEIIGKEEPDIVISDIEMPQMDGMELLEAMEETLPTMPEIILLTCHESFQFAQKAMQYGVSAYLLKPFRKEELTAVLTSSVVKCRRKMEGQRMKEKLQSSKRQLDRNQDYLMQNFLRGLFYRDITGTREELEKVVKTRGISFALDERYYLCLVGFNQTEMERRLLTDQEMHFILKNVASEVMYDQIDMKMVMDFVRGPYYFLMLPVSENFCTRTGLEERGERLIQAIGRYLHVKLSCVMSLPCCPENFADCFWKIMEQFKQLGTVRASVQWEDAKQTEELFESPFSAEDIREKIRQRKKVELIISVKNILEEIEKEGRLDGTIMHMIHQDIMQIFYSYLNESGIQAYRMFQDSVSRTLSNRVEYSKVDMIKYINYLFDRTMEKMDELQKENSLIGTVRKYIDKHYSSNIGRDEIAAAVCIAPSYLSKQFREETGQSLREYINSKRIDAAKQLMSTTKLNLTDIALQVGFENIPYFSTVFKKYCGVSPSEWKEKEG